MSNAAVNWATKGGRWVDLPPRVVSNMSLQFGTLAIASDITNGDARTGGAGWRYFFNVTNGASITTNADGALWSSTALIVGMNWVKDSRCNLRIVYKNSDDTNTTEIPANSPIVGRQQHALEFMARSLPTEAAVMTRLAASACVPDHPAAQPLDMRYVLPLCTAFSLSMHLLLLSLNATPEPPLQARHTASGTPGTLQTRIIANTLSAAVATPATEVTEPPAARRQPVPPPAPLLKPMRQGTALSTPDGMPQTGPESNAVAAPAGGAEHDDYVPRPLLTVPPMAQDPVLLTAPIGEPGVARRVGILSLFIDEQGRVQHITDDDPPLPPAFDQAARDAFMRVRFSPGQIDGQTVKSRLRIEVVFDNTPLGRP